MSDDTRNLRELAARETDGLSVALLWSADSDELTVSVHDSELDERFELPVREGDDPLDVFNHPYAYTLDRHVLPSVRSVP